MTESDLLAALDFEPAPATRVCAECETLTAKWSGRCLQPTCDYAVILCTACANRLAAALLISTSVHCAHCGTDSPPLLAMTILPIPRL